MDLVGASSWLQFANSVPEELLTLPECFMTPCLSTVIVQDCLIRVFRQDGVPWPAWSCYMEASTSPVIPIYTIFGHIVQKKAFFMMCRDCAEATPLQTSCVPSDAEMSRQEAGGRSEAASGFSAVKSPEADQVSALFP